MSNIGFYLTLGFVLFFGALMIGSIAWARWRRKTRWPFKDSEKLLRGPGETLKRRLMKFDEEFAVEFFVTLFAAALITPAILNTWKLFSRNQTAALIGVAVALLIAAAVSSWRITRLWKRRNNHYLGWYGERFTADKIRPLSQFGYRIYHDVPCDEGKNSFNIDHVVVGLTGVTIVETKTRRKGNARPGFKDHEVSFNGRTLTWPWGEDRYGIDQTINEGAWLQKWLVERLNLRINVKCILTFPGWYVKEAPNPALRIVNTNFLPDVVRGRGEVTLTPEQVDLISRQLDVLCRDVED